MSNMEFEQNVLYEIFPAIVDSIHYDKRLIPPPPDFNVGEHETINSDSIYKEALEAWEEQTQLVLSDTGTIYIVVFDSVSGYEKSDSSELIDHFNKHDIITSWQYLSQNFQIDLSKLRTIKPNIKFKYRSDFPEGRAFWHSRHNLFIAGTFFFSRILFDRTRNFGVMNVGHSVGYLNGSGHRVFIRKDNKGRWIIDKVVETWIS